MTFLKNNQLSLLPPLALSVSGLFILAFTPSITQAADYTTSAFSWKEHRLDHLSWIFSSSIPEDDFSFEFQTASSPDNFNHWQKLSSYHCQTQNQQLKCQSPLPSNLDRFIQFRLTYPDEIILQSLNYHFDQTSSSSAETIDTQKDIYYSNFKKIDQQSAIEFISWQEADLIASPSSKIIVQTRASYDDLNWTNWTGNFTDLNNLSEQKGSTSHQAQYQADFEATEGSILLKNPPPSDFDKIHLTYLPLSSSYQLTHPAALGDQELTAFSNLSFQLNTLADLQLGEKLIISEQVGSDFYQASGIISDLKLSENLVTIFSWEGAIPYQLPSFCQDHHFCFSTQAQIQKVSEVFLSPSLYYNHSQNTISLPFAYQKILSLNFIQTTPPSCFDELNENNSLCENYGFSLSSYYQDNNRPVSLQYRLIYDQPKDKIVSQVYLHQSQPQARNSSSSLYRLRGGKIFNPTQKSRPYYWH